MKSPYKCICLVAGATLLLSGCVSHDISELEQYVQDINSRPGGRMEPLPEIKPYEAYTYKSAQIGGRDPFQPFYVVRREETMDVKDSGLTKELEMELKTRNREELEQYELDSLRMVGTLQSADDHWGIVLDPGGIVHRVKVGNYMGRNVGKVVNIFEDKIELREIVQNNQGRWEERQAAIALAE